MGATNYGECRVGIAGEAKFLFGRRRWLDQDTPRLHILSSRGAQTPRDFTIVHNLRRGGM